MADFILGGEFSFRSRAPDSATYFQGRTTAHKVVLICAKVIATHVGFYDFEIRVDRLVTYQAVLRAKLTERCQLLRGVGTRKWYTMNRRSR